MNSAANCFPFDIALYMSFATFCTLDFRWALEQVGLVVRDLYLLLVLTS